MLKQQFLQEIQSSTLMINSSGYESINHISNSILAGTFNPEIMKLCITSTHGEIYSDPEGPENPFDSWQEGSIAIIPLFGIMMKYGYWWSYGVDEIAGFLKMAYDSDKIAGVILKGDTPGGSTNSLFLIQEVLSERTKPTYGFVDGMCCSCGYIAFSYLDKIYAINRMAQVGGIGVFARMMVPNKENDYYKVIEVYPEESKDKNLPEREAAEGNTAKMKEELSKLALYFRDTVTANRPDLSPDTLTGSTYYAYEAETLGMINGIRTLSQVVKELENTVQSRKEIISIINI